MKSPDDGSYWLWGDTTSRPQGQNDLSIMPHQFSRREKGAPKRRELAASGKAAKRARRLEREELARQALEVEIAEVAEEMVKADQYGSNWGGF
ncbi:hypothetical protein [Paraburkholderia sp.]|uniref:hypothetical protein n=1 Tax=Paraburkholderia sp. TaxID=1926495 RepID=UPI0039E402CB